MEGAWILLSFPSNLKFLKTGYWDWQSEKEFIHSLTEMHILNICIIFMNIFKFESNDYQEEMRKDQLDSAEV